MDIVLDPLRWEALACGDQAWVQQWMVSDNDHVVANQLLAQVQVLGENVDIVAPHAGRIEEILCPVGERFHRGQALARLVAF